MARLVGARHSRSPAVLVFEGYAGMKPEWPNLKLPPWLGRFTSSGRSRRITLGVQAVVFDESGRILLIRHAYRPGWHFPGGGVERGEGLAHALQRELLEETGLVLLEPPVLHGLFANFPVFPGDHIAVFKARRWRRDHHPLPNSEIAEQGFFARDDLPPGTSSGTIRRLEEIAGGANPVLSW